MVLRPVAPFLDLSSIKLQSQRCATRNQAFLYCGRLLVHVQWLGLLPYDLMHQQYLGHVSTCN